MGHRSHLSLIPLEKLFPGRNDILVYKHPSNYVDTLPQTQRHPGPDQPHWKISISEWPTVLRRVEENHEPLRQVAKDYNVSYEAVRRVLRAARNQRKIG